MILSLKNLVDPDPTNHAKEYERRDTGDGVLELMLHPTFSLFKEWKTACEFRFSPPVMSGM